MPDPRIRLEIDGPIATITNDWVEKRNAFDDDMDLALFEALTEIKGNPEIRAVIWRGEGKAWSSGRDVGSIGQQDIPLIYLAGGAATLFTARMIGHRADQHGNVGIAKCNIWVVCAYNINERTKRAIVQFHLHATQCAKCRCHF